MNQQYDQQFTGGKRETPELGANKMEKTPSQKEWQVGVRVEQPDYGQEAKQEKESTKEKLEHQDSKEKEEKEQPGQATPPAASQEPVAPPRSKTVMRKNIEMILSEDLSEIYNQMDAKQKKEFRAEGEKVASKIEKMLQEVKVKAKEVLKLIRNWLKKIPGINSFFLIQEAKIKTDKILSLKNKK